MKSLLYLLVFVGGLIGSYIPVWFWHASAFSGWSLVLGGVGSIAGIWAALKMRSYFEY